MSKNNSSHYIVDTFFRASQNIARTFFGAFREVFLGIFRNTINWVYCGAFICLANTICWLGWDIDLSSLLGIGPVYVKYPAFGWFAYFLCGLFGFFSWGLYSSYNLRKVKDHLRGGLVSAGLKTLDGKYPEYLEDVEMKQGLYHLMVKSNGVTLQEFKTKKENLESALNIYIDDFRERKHFGIIDIYYAHEPMFEYVEQDTPPKYPFKYYIGFTRKEVITGDFRSSPHLLVGGQSGYGKSTLLRNIFVNLFLNHKSAEFLMIDLKEGMEYQIFDNLKRTEVQFDVKGAFEGLIRADKKLSSRMEKLRDAGCKDLEAYEKLRRNEPKKYSLVPRLFIFVDEASEIYGLSAKTSKSLSDSGKAALSRISRMGRAAGVHLIYATQKPDVNMTDSQVKANLGNIGCFKTDNTAHSVSVLSNAQAAYLPDIRGRLVWKKGGVTEAVQSPDLAPENVEAWLKPYRIQRSPKPKGPTPPTMAANLPGASYVKDQDFDA